MEDREVQLNLFNRRPDDYDRVTININIGKPRHGATCRHYGQPLD